MIPWQIVLYPLDGGPPEPWALTEGGRSLSYCQRMVSLWQGSFCNDGLSEAIIEPLHGWESVTGDPVLAICHALFEHDVTPDVGAAQLRALFDDRGDLGDASNAGNPDDDDYVPF